MKKFPKKRLLISLVVLCFLMAYARTKKQDHQPVTGKLDDKAMDEISDISASSIYPNIYYVHNDSGDTSRFFAITPEGHLKSTFYFIGHPKQELFGVRDCEDMAVGPGPKPNDSYVYLGDIGDNNASRKYLTVYRFNENELNTNTKVSNVSTVAVNLKYPDGPKDAETFMVDPVEKLMYIVSKRKGSVNVYTAPLTYKADDTLMLTNRCQLHFRGIQPLKWIVAGDISKDGKQVLLKSYVKVYYWKREGNEPIWQTMQRPPQELPYEQEKQGEAIGFAPDGKSYYTTSEGANAPVYHYQIP